MTDTPTEEPQPITVTDAGKGRTSYATDALGLGAEGVELFAGAPPVGRQGQQRELH